MTWTQLVIQTSAEQADTLSELLTELGALSVTLVDAKDEPLFQRAVNETPLWQETCVKALFETLDAAEKVVAQLKKSMDFYYEIESIADQDWVRKTQQDFPAQCFAEKLWVLPSWHEEPVSKPHITIDPGLAFGTGTHPTTALCLEWLAQHAPIDLNVIDYGCGSGILSLAALALSAKAVWAIDHDPQALIATRNNAALNDFIQSKALNIMNPEEAPEITVDLVIANILANPLITLAPTLLKYTNPNTKLLLSGLLDTEAQRVTDAYAPHFMVTETYERDHWLCLVLSSKNPRPKEREFLFSW